MVVPRDNAVLGSFEMEFENVTLFGSNRIRVESIVLCSHDLDSLGVGGHQQGGSGENELKGRHSGIIQKRARR